MLTHIEVFVFENLIVEDLDKHDLNDFSFRMNTKTKYDEINLFERKDK